MADREVIKVSQKKKKSKMQVEVPQKKQPPKKKAPPKADPRMKVFEENSLYVNGFPDTVTEEQIKELFPQTVTEIYLKTTKKQKKYAFVKFSTEKEMEEAVKLTDLTMGDNTIAARKFVAKFENAAPFDHEGFKLKLRGCKSVEEQMSMVQQEFEMKGIEMEGAEKAHSQIQEILEDFFPGIELKTFMTASSNFSLRGTNMTVFVDMGLDRDRDQKELENFPKRPLPAGVTELASLGLVEGMYTWEGLKAATIVDKLKLIKNLLLTHGEGKFRSLFMLKHGLALRMTHQWGIKIDLYLNHSIGLVKSELLQLYGSLDSRVSLLMYSLYYWIKCCPQVTDFLSQAMVQTMLFGYLAACKPPVLPSVQELAEIADSESVVEGQSISVQTDPSKVAWVKRNRQTVSDLLMGFFQYISQIDFDKYAWNTRTASLMPRTEYNAIRGKVICENREVAVITDHLTPLNNLCPNLVARKRDSFILDTLLRPEKMAHEHFRRNVTRDWGIAFLFFDTDAGINEKLGMVNQMMQYKVDLGVASAYSFPVTLPEDILNDATLPKNFRDRWFEEITLFLKSCMSELLLLEVRPVDNPPFNKTYSGTPGHDLIKADKAPQKHRKRKADDAKTETDDASGEKKVKLEPEGKSAATEEESGTVVEPQVIERSQVKQVHKCSAYYRVWSNRKNFKKVLSDNMTLAQDEYTREKQITREITNSCQPSADPIMEFYVSYVQNEDKSGVAIHMYPCVGAKEFSCFFHFSKSFIGKVVEKSFTMDMSEN